MARTNRKMGSPKIAIAYIRTSRDEHQQRFSPEAQRAAIERWAAANGVTVAAWHEERLCSVTAVEGREALSGALADLRANNAGLLVVAKRDRIARDVVLASVIEREVAARGARLVSCAGEGSDSTGSAGVLERGISDLMAAVERARIIERTVAALAVKRSHNERTGTIPYGYQLASDGVHLTPDAGEQETIARVATLRSSGLTLRSIVGVLAAEGVVGRTGRSIGLTQVAHMLDANPALAAAA